MQSEFKAPAVNIIYTVTGVPGVQRPMDQKNLKKDACDSCSDGHTESAINQSNLGSH